MDDTKPRGDSPKITAGDGVWKKGLHWMEE